MSTLDRQAVLECLSRLVTPGIKLTALADELGVRKHEYSELRSILFDLVEEGTVHVLSGGAFALAPSGRASDPRGKPLPDPDARDPEAPIDDTPLARAIARGKQAKKDAERKEKAAAKAAKDAARSSGRSQRDARPPWGTRPAPAAAPVRAQPLEEYDPETGEVRKVGAATVAAATAVSPAPAPAVDPRTTGRITVHPAGYGFVQLEGNETVFVPAKYRGLSLDGDRVALDTWPGHRGTEGRVTEVLARGRARLTGVLHKVGRAVYLEPDDPRIAADYGRVGVDSANVGKHGDAVVLEITRYPDAARRELAGKVIKVLGDPDDPRTEIEKILAVSMIPIEFPEEAIAQALATSQELTPGDFADRIDLRDRRFATIDPETARDFDDALCIEDGPHGGARVWVAVADVSHYVRWGDALDKEATIRGVSVYLPDRVIPMLRHELSAGICSLNPLVDRCAMVVRLDYNEEAELADVGYAAAVIRSKARLDYPGVAAALGGDFRGRRELYRPWADELARLDALAQRLRVKRRARGALDLEIAEPKVVLDADDPRLVRDVIKAKGDPAVKQAYQLVEEYMIAANEAVGAFFRKRGAPTVWRVHAPPKQDRVRQLGEMLAAYGIVVDVEAATTPLGMKSVLDQIESAPGAQALSFLVLRTLTQAVWDVVPIGHFGLASGDYLHFTSPIRRYPDLLVHRLLKYHLHRDGHPSGGGYAKPPPPVETLSELARNASGQERRAMEAEREAVAMYRAHLMRDQVGQEFDGVVSGVTSFGVFVEIDEPYVEGLIKLDTLGDERWDFDQVHMRLSGSKTGKTIELGDKVRVEINNVSVTRRRIDLTLIAIARKQTGRVTQHAGKSGAEGRAGAPPQRRAPEQRRGPEPRRAAAPEQRPNPRVGLSQRKAAGRAVEKAVTGTRVKASGLKAGGKKPAATGGRLRFGVSHRARPDDDDDKPKKTKKKPR